MNDRAEAAGARDEHFVHRLEAFSDIVIGFSLAQLTLTLVPRPPSQLMHDPVWMVAYVMTFAVVCLLWWSHYRLFRAVFVPDALNVVLNFAFLMTVGLLIFLLQIWYKQGSAAEFVMAARAYFSVLAANFTVSAVLTLRSARARRPATGEAAYWRAMLVGFSGAVCAVVMSAAIAASFGVRDPVVAVSILSVSVAIGWPAGRLLFGMLFGKRAHDARVRAATTP